MKLKQNSFKTVFKLFCFSFISVCGQSKIRIIRTVAFWPTICQLRLNWQRL